MHQTSISPDEAEQNPENAETMPILALQLSPCLKIIQQCLRLLLSLLPAPIPGHLLPHLVLLAADQPHPVQEEEEGVEDDQEDSHTTNNKQGPEERMLIKILKTLFYTP